MFPLEIITVAESSKEDRFEGENYEYSINVTETIGKY